MKCLELTSVCRRLGFFFTTLAPSILCSLIMCKNRQKVSIYDKYCQSIVCVLYNSTVYCILCWKIFILCAVWRNACVCVCSIHSPPFIACLFFFIQVRRRAGAGRTGAGGHVPWQDRPYAMSKIKGILCGAYCWLYTKKYYSLQQSCRCLTKKVLLMSNLIPNKKW